MVKRVKISCFNVGSFISFLLNYLPGQPQHLTALPAMIRSVMIGCPDKLLHFFPALLLVIYYSPDSDTDMNFSATSFIPGPAAEEVACLFIDLVFEGGFHFANLANCRRANWLGRDLPCSQRLIVRSATFNLNANSACDR